MSRTATVGYALARIHARHARRPSAGEWRQLELAPDRDDCLLQARHTGLAGWLTTLPDRPSVDETETRLREQLRRYITEVAGWLPAEWRPATAWLARLPDLDAIAYLGHGERALAWMDDDPALAAWLEPVGEGTVRGRTTGDPLRAAGSEPIDRAWARHWLGLVGQAGAAVPATLAPALVAMARQPWPAASASLVAMFRGRPLAVAAAFAHLGLVIGDLRRLAGLLACRLPVPARRPGTA